MASQPSTHKRIRAKRACLPCQQRKRKCDGNQPCSSCDGYGYACIFNRSDGPPTPQTTPPMQDVELRHRITCVAGDVVESIRKHVLPKPAAQESVLLDTTKSRFYSRHSAMAFPHLLGLEYQAERVPKLVCHAWNVEIRDRSQTRSITSITDAVDAPTARKYVEIFFERVHPVFGCLDLDDFIRRCGKLWNGQSTPSFPYLLTSVIVLGSYFADDPLENEAEISKLCDDNLQDPNLTWDLEPCHIGAMIFNSIYLRLTNQHSITWARSCSTMHGLESLGLHKDFEAISKAIGAPQLLDNWELTYRAKLFWTAWAFHQSLALETGRSAVQVDDITVKNPFPSPDESATAALCELGKVIPLRGINSLLTRSIGEQSQYFTDLLRKMRAMKKMHPVIALQAADVASSMYRRLLVVGAKQSIAHQITDLNAIYDEALTAAEALLESGQAWWHLVDSVFQLTCVLISLDSTQSVGILKRAMQVTQKVDDRFDSENTADAVDTSRMLIQALTAKKRRDLAALDDLTLMEPMVQPQPSEDTSEQLMGEEPLFSNGNGDLPDLFSQWSGPFEWTGSSGVEWNYPQEY